MALRAVKTKMAVTKACQSHWGRLHTTSLVPAPSMLAQVIKCVRRNIDPKAAYQKQTIRGNLTLKMTEQCEQ